MINANKKKIVHLNGLIAKCDLGYILFMYR